MLGVLGPCSTTPENFSTHAQLPTNTSLESDVSSLHINASDLEQLLLREELMTPQVLYLSLTLLSHALFFVNITSDDLFIRSKADLDGVQRTSLT